MLMTGEQYIESLRKLKTRVYMFGEKIDNWVDHPIIRPSINSVAMTYDLAHEEEYKDLMTAKSNLTGEVVNRFAHLHQNTDEYRSDQDRRAWRGSGSLRPDPGPGAVVKGWNVSCQKR